MSSARFFRDLVRQPLELLCFSLKVSRVSPHALLDRTHAHALLPWRAGEYDAPAFVSLDDERRLAAHDCTSSDQLRKAQAVRVVDRERRIRERWIARYLEDPIRCVILDCKVRSMRLGRLPIASDFTAASQEASRILKQDTIDQDREEIQDIARELDEEGQ